MEGKGPRDAAGSGGGDEGRGAGSVLGVEGPEIMIRPPTYGFNDKVLFRLLPSFLPSRGCGLAGTHRYQHVP